MKTVHALLIAALFTAAACKEKEAVKPAPAAKSGEPAQPAAAPGASKVEVTPIEPTPGEPAPAPAPAAAPAATTASIEAAGAKALDIASRFAKTVAEAGEDCDKVGTGLKALSAELQGVADEQSELLKDPQKRAAFSEKYQAQLNATLKPALSVIQKCAQNPEVKGVFELMRK